MVMLDTVKFLTERGVPVCGHIGLTPQSVHQLGGYKIQGKTEDEAERLLAEAKALEAAGAGLIVLELIPAALAKTISESLSIPTIGIGAGVDCDGQVLALYDMLGIYPGKKASFVKNFLVDQNSISDAVSSYIDNTRKK